MQSEFISIKGLYEKNDGLFFRKCWKRKNWLWGDDHIVQYSWWRLDPFVTYESLGHKTQKEKNIMTSLPPPVGDARLFLFLHCVILIMAAQQRSSIWVMFIWPVFACWPDMIVSNWWLNGPLIFVIDFRKSFSSFSSSGNSRSSTLLRATSPLISWQSAFRISKMPPRFYMFYFLFFSFPPPIFLFHSGSLLLDWF